MFVLMAVNTIPASVEFGVATATFCILKVFGGGA